MSRYIYGRSSSPVCREIHIRLPHIFTRSKSFQISTGHCIVNGMFKINLINERFVTQYQLEEMSAEWKQITLLSFGSSAKLLMNGFVSCHMWIKETFDKTCIEDYNSIPKDQ